MRRCKFILELSKRANFWPLVAVVLVGLLAGRGLIGTGYFNMHDDLQMMRQLSMEKCFLDGQFPCRWIPDMGYGFGYPLFNFYPPLPYLVGEGIRAVGFAFTETVKILFISSFVVSGITMYFLAKEFFGRLGAVFAATFYIWAPYHAVDVYVRGAMNEAWALMWVPAILWTSYRLVIDKKIESKWVIGLALSYFALFTSHNLMVMVFSPFVAVWIAIWLFRSKNWKRVPHLGLAGVLSFGLAAFFTLPVLIEQKLVQTDTLIVGYYEFTAHFVSVPQLFTSRFWGYGPSVWGVVDDGMSFQIGWLHWILPLIFGFFMGLKYLRQRKVESWMLASLFMFAIAWFSVAMTHNKTTPIWQLVDQLRFVQFPWRFLTVAILGFSFVIGGIVKIMPKPLSALLGAVFVIGAIAYSFNFFKPEHGRLGPLTDEEKFSGAAWELQQTAGIFDYLPNTAWTAPKAPQEEIAEVMDGLAQVYDGEQGTDWARFRVSAEQDSVLRLGILQFPDWRVFVNGVQVEEFVPEDERWGRMYINVPKGEHEVRAELHNTPVRVVGNLVSLGSWVALGGFLIHKKRS